MHPARLCGAIFAVLFSAPPAAATTAVDDAGRTITLEHPAARIISLAPHVTELLFSAGAGERVVGAVAWSDYPEAAAGIPRVGDTHSLDLERIVALQPDLVVAWLSGNGRAKIDRLEELGFIVFISEPANLERIGTTIRDLGELAGTETAAAAAAAAYRARLDSLRERHAGRPALTVFYQVWNHPMFTVNGQHLISSIIELCGGRNIFAHLRSLSPEVSIEAVLEADPAIIIASGAGRERPLWLDDWRQWPALKAVHGNHLYSIPPELLQRHTTRILDGVQQMCEMLEESR